MTIGLTGLAIGSWMIGAITGNDDLHLKTSLLVLPGASVLMVLISLLRRMVTRTGWKGPSAIAMCRGIVRNIMLRVTGRRSEC